MVKKIILNLITQLALTTIIALIQKMAFKRPYNMKVQVPQGNSAKGKDLNNARMVEFIVNLDTGEFDSQWDAYDNHKLADGRYDSNPEIILMKN